MLVSGPDAGHVLPIVGLGSGLARRGHQVAVATGANRRDAVEESGLEFLELPLLAPDPRDVDMGYRLWGRAAEMAPSFAQLLSTRHVDLVVTDTLTTVGAYAAELLDRPWIELSPHHLMEPSDHLPPIGLGRSPEAPWWRRRDDARLRRRQRDSIEAGRAYAGQHRQRIGLPAAPRPPVARLLATLPDLEYSRPDWPVDAHIVGPLAADPPWPALPPPPGEHPLVVVTDTTASGVEVSLADIAAEALGDLPVRGVITTGRDVATPANVVAGRGPHGPLLDEAALAVGPGGHGFVTKALSRGVPLVLVPLAGDQRETAARVRWTGMGRSMAPMWLRSPSVAVRRLRWEVLQVLADDGHRRRARAAAERAAHLGPDHAAELVEAVWDPDGHTNGRGRSAARS